MHELLIALAIFVAVGLVHLSYVDFRFRHRDGFWWYWLLSPAPPLMWLSRAAIVIALLVALSVTFIGTNEALTFVLIGLVLVHIASLVLLEILEPR